MEGLSEIKVKGGGGGSVTAGYNYLYSPTRIYLGMIERDGSFVVFRGANPEERHDALWSTSVGDPGAVQGARSIGLGIMGNNARGYPVYARVWAEKDGRYYDLWNTQSFRVDAEDTIRAVVEDDGTFRLFAQADGTPTTTAKTLWKSNETDPVVEYELSKLTYDLAAVQIMGSAPATILTLEASNDTNSDQTPSVGGSYSLSTTSGWSNSLAVKFGIKVSGETGVPLVAEGKIEVSTEVQNTYTWNGSKTESQSYSFSAPLKLAPHTRGKVLLTATNTRIKVPYYGTGDLVFKSGKRSLYTVHGMFEGENQHSVKAEFHAEDMPPRPLKLTTMPGSR